MIYLYTYFSIAAISSLSTACWLLENPIEGIDSFWDWVIYNLFWIVQPIKSIIKFLNNLSK